MAIETPTDFMGQWIAGGIIDRAKQKAPIVGLEANPANTLNEKAALLQNIALFGNLVGKVLDVRVRETEIFNSSLKQIFTIEAGNPYGIGFEMLYMTNLPGTSPDTVANHKNADTCFPGGTSNAVSTLYAENGATYITWMVYDNMLDGAVMNEMQMSAIMSEIMKQYLVVENRKTLAEYAIRIADCVPGKRSVTSTTTSLGNGTSVSYSAKPAGYLASGAVFATDIVLQKPTEGEALTISVPDQLEFLEKLRTIVRDMKDKESTTFNKLGVATFAGDKLRLVVPSKLLDAMDANFLINTGSPSITYLGVPTRSARDVIGEIMGGRERIIEIAGFEDLPDYDSTTYPTSTDYSAYNMMALIYTDGMFKKIIKEAGNLEVARCAGARAYSYNYLERYMLVTLLGEPAAAIFAKKGSLAKFMMNAGDLTTVYATQYANPGDDVDVPAVDPTYAAHTFVGWNTDPTAETAMDLSEATVPYAGVTYYAIWTS